MRTQNEIDGIDLDWREEEDFDEMVFRGRSAGKHGQRAAGKTSREGRSGRYPLPLFLFT